MIGLFMTVEGNNNGNNNDYYCMHFTKFQGYTGDRTIDNKLIFLYYTYDKMIVWLLVRIFKEWVVKIFN